MDRRLVKKKFPGIWREALRQGRLDVSLAEAIAFEEKGFSGRFGQQGDW